MRVSRFIVSICSVGLSVLGASTARGQNFPNKPIRIVTPGTGGGGDSVARAIAQGVSANLGQPVVVDNRPSGVMPGEIVSKAPPDGYTLLVAANLLWIGPFLQNTPYDPVRDFLPITLAVSLPNILVTHPSLPIKSVQDLIAVAKARPGTLNYASSATGSAGHLAAELFKAMAGVDIVRVSYKGAGAALNDMLGGQVQLMFPNAVSVAAHVKSGRLRALAVTSAQPSALVPGLPTVAAAGVPGYEAVSLVAAFAPARTPAAIINRLNQEIVRVLNTPDVKERFFNAGAETVAGSPAQLAATIKSEMARMGKVIRQAGIRGE